MPLVVTGHFDAIRSRLPAIQSAAWANPVGSSRPKTSSNHTERRLP